METNNKRIVLMMIVGLWLSTMLLFAPARNFGFLSYDDGKYVYENDMVQQGLNPETLRWAFTGPHFHMWHPLTSLSHLVDVQLFGMNPGAHHLVNILIHALNAVLLLLFLLRATGDRWASLLVAVLFAWHPLRAESVVWISERKDVLCTLFWLLTFHVYLLYTRSGSRRAYWLAVGVYALGIMTKPMIVTLPCVLLLLDFWPLKRWLLDLSGKDVHLPGWSAVKPLLVEKIPFFLLSALLAVLTYQMQKEGEVLAMMDSLSLVDRFGNAMLSYVRYTGKLFWPVDLAILYPHPGQVPVALMLGASLIVAALLMIAWLQRGRQPWLATGILWFLGVIVPASGIVQAGGQAMADRYTYVSTIGLIIAVVWTAKNLLLRLKWGQYVMACLIGTALAGCWITTSRQVLLWRDTETLFRHAIEVTEKNSIAMFIVGYALLEKDRPEEAIEQFTAGLKLNPEDKKAWLQLGRARRKTGDIKRAIASYEEALRIDPLFEEARFQLATTLAQDGRTQAAEQEFLRLLRETPEWEAVWNNLGNVQFLQQKYADAEASYLQAARLRPDNPETWMNLANLFLQQSDGKRGLEHLERALILRPEDVQLWYDYAGFCEQYGAGAKAVAAFRKVLLLAPNRMDAAMRLAWRLAVDPDPAVRNGKDSLALVESLMLQAGGGSGPVSEILAAAKAENGLWTDAVFWAESALKAYQRQGDAAGEARLKLHLENYRQSKPWRSATTP